MTIRRLVAAITTLLFAGALGAAVAGCGGKKSNPVGPPPDVPPNPNTPVNAVLLLQWALQHRDTTQYRTLFPNEYTFEFVLDDTAATNHFSGTWRYGEERASARHLFQEGSPGLSRAATITIPYSGTLTEEADLRPGKNALVHRKVRASFILTVIKQDLSTEQIIGGASFYLVRGDSATVPSDLAVAANSSRWFIETWVDETGGVVPQLALRPASPAHPTPTSLPTWGQLKVRYVPPAPIAQE